MKTKLLTIIIVLLCTTSIHIQSQETEKIEFETRKTLLRDQFTLESFPALQKTLKIEENTWFLREEVEQEIKTNELGLWDETLEIFPLLNEFHFKSRRKVFHIIGKLASKGSEDIRKQAEDFICQYLKSNHDIQSWNDVADIIVFLESLSEIRSDRTMDLLLQSNHREFWENRITIVEISDDALDSWGNGSIPLPVLRIKNIKKAVIKDFIGTTSTRLYFSSHPVAEQWRMNLQSTDSRETNVDPHVLQFWKYMRDRQPQYMGKGDQINENPRLVSRLQKRHFFDF